MTGIRSGFTVAERTYAPVPSVDRHSFFQVVLPQRGRLEMEIGGQRGFAGETRFAYVPAGVEHRYWSQGPNRFLVLDVAPRLMAEARHGLGHPAPSPAEPFLRLDERLAALSTLLRAELARGGLHEPLIAESLGLYAGSLLLQPPALPDPERVSSPAARRLAARTRDFLAASYREPLSIAEIAMVVGASASHMQRCFRAHVGTSIVGYLQTMRLERAKELLLTTDLSITEVAFAAGFHDLSYFTRLFRRELGIAPSRYRAAIRAGSDKHSR